MREKAGLKKIDKIILYNIDSIVLDTIPEHFGILKHKKGKKFVCLSGEYFYSGRLVDGQMIISENRFNALIDSLDLTLNKINGSTIYFQSLSKKQLLIIRNMNLKAKMIGEEYPESETEELYSFILVEATS